MHIRAVYRYSSATRTPRSFTRTVAPAMRVYEPDRHPSLHTLAGGLKRAFDVLAVLVGGTLLLPLLLLVALAIRLDSRGPVLFRQRRVGLHGREFTIYKFRSMYLDAEQRLASLRRYSRSGMVSRGAENQAVDGLIKELSIKTPHRDALVRELSGGNQQKVAIAKWLSCQSRVYVLDEPTVAVDVGAKVEIYNLLNRLAGEGAAILLLSSDLLELVGVCDRVLVVYRGRLAGNRVLEDRNLAVDVRFRLGAELRHGDPEVLAGLAGAGEHDLPIGRGRILDDDRNGRVGGAGRSERNQARGHGQSGNLHGPKAEAFN